MFMKFPVMAGFALKALRTNKLRTALTMLGIIIGVAAVIVIIALGESVQNEALGIFNQYGMNAVMVWPSSDPNNMTQEDADAVACISGVDLVIPQISTRDKVSYEDNKWNMRITGTIPEDQDAEKLVLEEGRFLSQSDLLNGANYAVIGYRPYEKLFPPGVSPIGEEIKIRGINFTVIGLLAPSKRSTMLEDMDDCLYIPITTARQRLQGASGDTIQGMWIRTVNADGTGVLQEEIRTLLRERHHLQDDQDDDFMIQTMQQALNQMYEITNLLTLFLSGIAGISLLVGGIGIMNIMLVSVTERTKEIGIRMAIGATQKDIMVQFLLEAVLLSLAGCVAGVLFGIAASQIFGYFVGWAVSVPLKGVLLSAGFSSLVGIVFGFYPARRAARLNPSEALGYE